MIDATEAASKAREYFDRVFEGAHPREILLEEIELSEDEKFWMVTFGFDWNPTSGTASIGPGDRKFKILRLAASSGTLISMKNTMMK